MSFSLCYCYSNDYKRMRSSVLSFVLGNVSVVFLFMVAVFIASIDFFKVFFFFASASRKQTEPNGINYGQIKKFHEHLHIHTLYS